LDFIVWTAPATIEAKRCQQELRCFASIFDGAIQTMKSNGDQLKVDLWTSSKQPWSMPKKAAPGSEEDRPFRGCPLTLWRFLQELQPKAYVYCLELVKDQRLQDWYAKRSHRA